MEIQKNAVSYVINFIKSLVPKAKIEYGYKSLVYRFYIRLDDNYLEARLGHAEMSDLETSLVKNVGIDRRTVAENEIKFNIYILLGKSGLIPNVAISEELLNEKRDWLKHGVFSFSYDQWVYDIFYQGLQQLSTFLKHLFESLQIEPSEAKKEKEYIESLIDHYDKKGTFDEKKASVESLRYFKAAAICYILDKEQQKKAIAIPSALKELDNKIYSIVEKLRANPFPQIKTLICINDYSVHIKEGTLNENMIDSNRKLTLLKNWVPFASNKIVFIAHRFNETDLVDQIKKMLEKNHFRWVEGKVEDLGYITNDILDKIKKSGLFLALVTPQKQFKDEKFSTSSWILMEIGVAIAFDRTVLVLAENVVEQGEYARKLQADSQYEVFDRGKDFDSKLKVAIRRIRKEWEKHNP